MPFLVILSFYVITFTGIAIWRYENFLYIESGDLTIFEQVIYNTLHGRPFYSTGDGQNHFGVHNSPTLALLIPFAAVIPVPYVLYTFTVLSFAVSAVPIYLIVKDEFRNVPLALLLGTAYVMLPAFVGQVYQSFHEINLVLPFLTFAFYYFVKERFYPFVAMFIMGLMVKEDVSATFFMFAVYAILKKRSAKWYLFPSVISITWFLLSIKVIVPFFDKSHSYRMISYFSNIGDSFGEIITNILFYPQNTLKQLLQLEKVFYLFLLFLPVGLFLPFFSTEIVFIIPSLFLNMLAETTRFRYVQAETLWGIAYFPRHMSLMIAAFLFISAMYSLKNISLIFGKYAKPAMFTLTFLLLIMIGYGDRFIVYHKLYKRLPEAASTESIKKILSKIPLHATVRADKDIATHLYNRGEINPSDSILTDYLILQGTFSAYNKMTQGTQLVPLPIVNPIREDDLLVFDNVGKPVGLGIGEKYYLVALERGIALFKKR